MQLLQESLRSDDHEVPRDLVPVIVNRLHRLYMAGIMNTAQYRDFARDSTSTIRIVNGKEAQSLPVNLVYSTMSAYEQLFMDDHLAAQRSVLQKCNLNEFIEPNLIYDKDRSQTELNDLLSGISPASGMVLAGQKIIDRGEIINDYDYRVLSSLEREMQRRSSTPSEITSTIVGQILFVTILIGLFTMYLALFRKDYFAKPRNILMLYVMVTLFPVLISLQVSHNLFSVYILPLIMVPIFCLLYTSDAADD